MELQLQLLEKVLLLVEEEELEIEGMEQHLVKLDQIRIHLQIEDFLVEEVVVVMDLIHLHRLKLQEGMDPHTQAAVVEEHQDLHQEDLLIQLETVVVVVQV